MIKNEALLKQELSNLKSEQEQVSEWMKDYLKGFQANIIHGFSIIS